MQSILGNTRKADISFRHDGRIDITSHVAKHLHLKRGDVLDILSDGVEFYLYVKFRFPANGRHEATVYPSNKKGNNFRAWSHRLCAAMLGICGASECARLCVGQPVADSRRGILLPVITKYLL